MYNKWNGFPRNDFYFVLIFGNERKFSDNISVQYITSNHTLMDKGHEVYSFVKIHNFKKSFCFTFGNDRWKTISVTKVNILLIKQWKNNFENMKKIS